MQHPNVVHLYGIYTSSTKEKFLVTEYLSKGKQFKSKTNQTNKSK